MKTIITIIIFSFMCQLSDSQQLILELNTGYSSNNLSELKAYQLELRDMYSDLVVVSLEKFPDNVFFSYAVGLNLNSNNSLFLIGSNYSTGGRNQVKDYSGEYKLDMLLNYVSVGLRYRRIIIPVNKYTIYAQIDNAMHFSNLKINESLVAGNQNIIDKKNVYTSNTFFSEPSIGISYRIFNKINLNLCIGYEFNFNGVLNDMSNLKYTLLNSKGEQVHVNWSGFRTSFGISLPL